LPLGFQHVFVFTLGNIKAQILQEPIHVVEVGGYAFAQKLFTRFQILVKAGFDV